MFKVSQELLQKLEGFNPNKLARLQNELKLTDEETNPDTFRKRIIALQMELGIDLTGLQLEIQKEALTDLYFAVEDAFEAANQKTIENYAKKITPTYPTKDLSPEEIEEIQRANIAKELAYRERKIAENKVKLTITDDHTSQNNKQSKVKISLFKIEKLSEGKEISKEEILEKLGGIKEITSTLELDPQVKSLISTLSLGWDAILGYLDSKEITIDDRKIIHVEEFEFKRILGEEELRALYFGIRKMNYEVIPKLLESINDKLSFIMSSKNIKISKSTKKNILVVSKDITDSFLKKELAKAKSNFLLNSVKHIVLGFAEDLVLKFKK